MSCARFKRHGHGKLVVRSIGAALMTSAALATSACTIAGAAMGAASPHYESSDWPREAIPLGVDVRVRVRKVGTDSLVFSEIEGRYGGVHDGLLSVTDDTGHQHELAVRDVIDLDVRSGTQWKKGLLLGAAADGVVAIVAVAIANGENMSLSLAR